MVNTHSKLRTLLGRGLASLALVASVASGALGLGAREDAFAQRSLAVASATTIVTGGAVQQAPLPRVASTTKVSAIALGKAAHSQQTVTKGSAQLARALPPAFQSPAQLAALAAYDQAHPDALPQAVSAPAPLNGNMYGSSVLPVKQNAVLGPNSTMDPNYSLANLTIQTAGAYTAVGTNQTYSLYDSSLNPVVLGVNPSVYFSYVGTTMLAMSSTIRSLPTMRSVASSSTCG